MRALRRWIAAVALLAVSAAQTVPTVCDDESCYCDSFTRVICNCTNDYDEVTLRPDGAYRVPVTTTGILINGCARVYFLENTAKSLQHLRAVQLRNIQHVYFKERSLSWSPYPREFELANPGLKITISNCTVNEIASHAIKGRIDDIVISDSRINVVKPFAFSSLIGVKNIELTNNIYDNIDTQAFKTFTVGHFTMRGGRVRTLPSRFLSDVEVTNLLKIDNVHMDHLSSLAFLVTSPRKVSIENNNIGVMEGDCFHVVTRGPIEFRNNTVQVVNKGAFLGFSSDNEVTSVSGKQELLVESNTMGSVQAASLQYNASALWLRLGALYLNASCDCAAAAAWRAQLAEQSAALLCWHERDAARVPLALYASERCHPLKQHFWIFLLVAALLVLLLGALIAFYLVRRENEKKKKVQIVMPDGKTYRETEFHIVVERAELLTTDL